MTQDDLIPVAEAMIWWNDAGGVVVDRQVVNGRDNERPDRLLGGDADNTNGCCMSGWPDTPPWTPLAQFFSLVLDSEVDIGEALQQFAKIDTCDWARYALATTHGGDHLWCTPGERRLLADGLFGFVVFDQDQLDDPEMRAARR